MSFYFQKKEQGRSAPRGAAGKLLPQKATTPAMRSNAPALWRAGCAACPQNTAKGICTPKMAATLTRNTQILFLAEAPGRDEDENTGKPLTGPSGSLLRECIPPGEGAYCSFDNVINCRPEGNRTPVFAEIECCRPRRIKVIEEAKPRLIVGLGAIPMQWMLGSTDMAGMRGRFFAVKIGSHSCYYMPTYHPSFILRVARDKKKPLNSMMGHCFRMDIKRAFDSLGTLHPPHIDTEAEVRSGVKCFSGGSTQFQELSQLLQQAQKAPLKAIDIETRFLRPYAEGAGIMSVAISFDDTHFAFAIDHPKSGWLPKQRGMILDQFEKLLKDDTIKIAHNAPFEVEWLAYLFGKEVIRHEVWECTMMQAHFLDERKGARRDDDTGASRYQGMDFLCKQHFGIAYKALFPLNKKDMAKSNLDDVLLYNGVDTKYTLRLFKRQMALLKKHKLLDAYYGALPRQPTVGLMQLFGVPVDQVAVKAAQNKLNPEIARIEAEIKELKVVKAFIKDKKGFNPHSGNDVICIFKDYLKRPEVVIKSDKGEADRLSTDKNVLDQIDHPLAKMIVELRNKSKMASTYVDGLELNPPTRKDGKKEPIRVVFPDGRLHTSLNTTIAETGRLSSSDPNLQNFPQRKDKWLRSSVIPPKGCLFVAVDYGQLEACTGAMCSRDKFLVKSLWEDYDIHQEWAIRTAHDCPALIGGKANLNDKAEMKKFRSLIKNKLVFPAFFGASNESVRGYLANACDYNLDQSKVDKWMDDFWEAFEGMSRWQKSTMTKYYDVGHVETLQGRKRHYPLTKNQAINHPVQGTAAELVCDAMSRLSHLASSTNQWHLHPILNVHDDLSFFIPDSDQELDASLEIIKREMLTFDFPWINVPLSIEISIGPNWADVQSIGRLWSHKDL